MLHILIFMEEIENFLRNATMDSFPDKRLRQYTESIVNKQDVLYYPLCTGKKMGKLVIPTEINNAKVRITQYRCSYIDCIESIGYNNLNNNIYTPTNAILMKNSTQ